MRRYSVPVGDCDCWRLIRPLMGGSLPDHVCEEMLRWNVVLWAEEYWQEQRQDFRILAKAVCRTAPEQHEQVEETMMHLDRSAAQAIGLWPLPLNERRLGLVIREWVQEDGSRTLANQLSKHAGWRQEVSYARTLYRAWLQLTYSLQSVLLGPGSSFAELVYDEQDIDPTGFVEGTGWWISGSGSCQVATPSKAMPWLGDDPAGERLLGRRLRSHGLPDTPATIRHLRAAAAGKGGALPARGVLVTTRVFVKAYLPPWRSPDEGAIVFIDPQALFTTSGLLEWTNSDRLDKAGEAVRRHQDWVRKWGQHPLTLPSVVHSSAQPSSTRATLDSDDCFDYLAEALNVKHEVLRCIALSRDPEVGLSRHLIRTKKRVDKRRRNSGIPTTSPAGWTKQARDALRRQIQQIGSNPSGKSHTG